MAARWLGALSRLRFVFNRDRLSDDVAEELEAHVEMLSERYVAAGMSREEAMLAARRQLGNTVLVREDVYRMNSVAWFEAVATDLRYAARTLFRDRAFSLAAMNASAMRGSYCSNACGLAIAVC